MKATHNYNPKTDKITNLQLATEQATYHGGTFGVALTSSPQTP